VAQEDTAKLSKRAQRRQEQADQSGEVDPSGAATSEAEGEGETPADEGEAPAGTAVAARAPAATEPSNRKGRRTAAAKARAIRKRERAEASAMGLDASEVVDDVFVRVTDKVTRWVRKNFNTLQWVLVIGVVGGIGYNVYRWSVNRTAAKNSDALFVAIKAEQGRVGDPEEQGKPDSRGVVDPSPIFKTNEERLAAALKGYDEALAKLPAGGTRAFAALGRAGVLLETGKVDEALAAYEEVKASAAAEASPVLRGRALEGIVNARDVKGDAAGALQASVDLAKVEGFEELGLYQQARLQHAAKDDAAAKASLIKLFEKLGPPPATSMSGEPPPPGTLYVRERAGQLAAEIDPLEKEVHIPRAKMDSAALQELIRQMQEQQGSLPAAPAP
jgi:hypothetical protein